MMMYRRPLVPEEFKVPTELIAENFVFRPLTINYVDNDFEAVQNSVDKEGKATPRPELTKEQNLVDLAWHQKEFQKRSSFAYTILSPDEKECLGCVYIYPKTDIGTGVEVGFWVTQEAYEQKLHTLLDQALTKWLAESWPLSDYTIFQI